MTTGIYWVYQPSRDRAVYVGSSVNIDKRWREHRSVLTRGLASNRYFQRVWNKYGANDLEFKVLEECAPERLIEREQFWADALEPVCNLAEFVDNPTRGTKFSDEQRQKLSTAHKGNKQSAETRAKIGKTSLGRRHTEEAKQKISVAMLGNRRGANPTEETRQKMRESATRAWARRRSQDKEQTT